MNKYSIWITLFGSSAKNAGIIGSAQRTRSSWTSGKLEYIPVNDGSQVNFTFEAKNEELSKLWSARYPTNHKPLSGKSYLRTCRVKPV